MVAVSHMIFFQLSSMLFWCSRCTGYRPILDAFKVFAKADPAAYTEESIAASKGLQNGQSANGAVENGHAENGHATNGHATHGHGIDEHDTNGHVANGQDTNTGNCDGHDETSKGTVKELVKACKSKDGKVMHCSNAVSALSYHCVHRQRHSWVFRTADLDLPNVYFVIPAAVHHISPACSRIVAGI